MNHVVDVSAGASGVAAAPAVLETKGGAAEGRAENRYLRGSSLLLAGRVISTLLNFAVQVLTVRYLSKSDYGAFAYALALVSMSTTAIHLGLEKAIPRLIPIYNERRDYARTFGSIGIATATVWGLGLSLVFLLFGFRGIIAGSVINDPQSLSLLLILIALSPVGAYTTILEKLVAVFSSPRAILFRRHVLGPGMKLAAVLVVMLFSGDVYLLAYGYLVGGLIGVWVYVAILLHAWRKKGLLQYLRPAQWRLNPRELFGFSLPLLLSDLTMIMRGSLVVIILEYFHSTTSVAEFRAVLSVAGLNLVVYEAFSLLFVPLASRMFARNETDRVSELYWKSCLWIAVLTFPVFAVTAALAEPVTVLLFGGRYSGIGLLLAVLAVGHYFNAALGFNTAALRVHGKLRIIITNDILAAVTAVALSFLLIPRYGALGAALTTSATFVCQNIFAHVGMWRGRTGIRLIEGNFVRVYLTAILLMLAVLLLQWLVKPHIYVSFAVVAAVSLVLIRSTRRVLQPETTFPELLRLPLVRQLLS